MQKTFFFFLKLFFFLDINKVEDIFGNIVQVQQVVQELEIKQIQGFLYILHKRK